MVAITFAVIGGFAWEWLVDRIGPKRTLNIVLARWMCTFVAAAAMMAAAPAAVRSSLSSHPRRASPSAVSGGGPAADAVPHAARIALGSSTACTAWSGASRPSPARSSGRSRRSSPSEAAS